MKFIPWTRVGIAAGILIFTALFAAYKIEERRADKLQTQVIKWQRAFAKLSTERNEQRTITRTRIVEVERKSKSANTRARRVETAPLPGQCKTPEAVLGADL